MAVKTFQELYDAFIQEVQSRNPDLTDTIEGSKLDILAGVTAMAASEALATLVDEVKKTFIDTAHGPEVTGGPDDLQKLLVDHFGSSFARPAATKATGVVTFSRSNTDAGNVLIPAGTVVKTAQNSAGSSQRFVTETAVTMTSTSINASVLAVHAGVAGNVQSGTVVEIESSLSDPSVTVTNSAAFTGGAAEETDAEYRETARRLLTTLKGATLEAIVNTALNVPGVETATGKEFVQYVKEWNIAESQAEGEYFAISRVKLYIADANGEANDALIEDVQEAVSAVRAAGVQVEVLAATAIEQNWDISIVLDPEGPNFETLQTDTTMIEDTMRLYMQALDIGEDFNRALAKQHLMNLWGPDGTGDITNLTVLTPTGDVSADENEKIIPGTMSVS